MGSRWKIAVFVAAACLISGPAIAQDGSSIADKNVLWNIIGLVGLLGLRGLWRDSDNDGYTDDPV